MLPWATRSGQVLTRIVIMVVKITEILKLYIGEKIKELYMYRTFPKYSDTQNICCNHSKIWTMWPYRRVMSPNDADGMANSVDPDQTAPLVL